MNIQEAYTRWSETYDTDRNLTRDLDRAVTRETLAGARCRSVLEIGCGTGKNTAFLVEIGERVVALDFSEGMIAVAREKVRAASVTLQTADITRPWPCGDRSVDLIVCNLVLEHVQELGFIFAEAARVLEANGRFLLCELHPYRQYQGSKANFQQEQDEESTAVPAFLHHVSDFTRAAEEAGLSLLNLREWWHEEDHNRPPRLVSFLFAK